MGRRKTEPPSQFPPDAKGFHRGPPGVYLEDDYSLTPAGEALKRTHALTLEREAEERENDYHDDVAKIERHAPVSDDPMQGTAIHLETKRQRKIREEEAKLSPDPADWIKAVKMTRTETSLRLAFYLLRSGHLTSDVTVAITGKALTSWHAPKFPVETWLRQLGWHPINGSPDWRTIYRKANSPHALQLTRKRGSWDVVAQVAPDARILILASGGTLAAKTRSAAEHGTIPLLVGRVMGRETADGLDLPVIAVPRTGRLRRIAAKYRQAPMVMRAGISLCVVDRAGQVAGLPFLGESTD